MAVITFGNRLDPLATPLHRMIEKYLSNRQRDSWAVFFVALRLWCKGIIAHPESVASTRLPGIPHHWNSVMSRYILKCCTGRGRADGKVFQIFSAKKGKLWYKMIQNDTIQVLQEGPYNYRVTTATFASKGHEQVQTVQTLPRLASPHTGHVEPTWDHTLVLHCSGCI